MNELYNYKFFHENLSSSGMPTAEQMKSVAEAGVQLVINLAPHDVKKAIPNEPELVEALGMQSINIPVNWGTPTKDGLNIFMDAMDANQDKKIHVHCEANFRAVPSSLCIAFCVWVGSVKRHSRSCTPSGTMTRIPFGRCLSRMLSNAVKMVHKQLAQKIRRNAVTSTAF